MSETDPNEPTAPDTEAQGTVPAAAPAPEPQATPAASSAPEAADAGTPPPYSGPPPYAAEYLADAPTGITGAVTGASPGPGRRTQFAALAVTAGVGVVVGLGVGVAGAHLVGDDGPSRGDDHGQTQVGRGHDDQARPGVDDDADGARRGAPPDWSAGDQGGEREGRQEGERMTPPAGAQPGTSGNSSGGAQGGMDSHGQSGAS